MQSFSTAVRHRIIAIMTLDDAIDAPIQYSATFSSRGSAVFAATPARRLPRLALALSFAVLPIATDLAMATDRSPVIAGLTPHVRPVGAPRLVDFVPAEGWHAQALRGIEGTPPPLRFLADQGAWYTPFDRPGMPGPYDLRGWHRAAEERR